jgi:hypothetical protein
MCSFSVEISEKYFENFELNKIRSGIQQWERHDDREKRCVETSEGQGKLSQWVVSSAASSYGCAGYFCAG